ncbi:Fc.00g064240.m01.CDS01 [Cosmosporella sp. VM-42]
MAETYGPLVRLWGVQPSQIPPTGASSEAIKPLLASILQEAIPFISTVPTSESPSPASPWQFKSVRNFPHSKSPVQLYERTVSEDDLEAVSMKHNPPAVDTLKVRAETWALRRSVHEDKDAEGTATWEEFVKCFKEEHAESEKEFTPSVLTTNLEQQWDCSGISIDLEGTTWTNWTLKSESSLHNLPVPLKNRLFPILQATASAEGHREFLVVQIAVRAGDGDHGDQGVVRGAYTSVERLKEIEGGLEWTMGTVSDAKGIVPAWVQRMAVPGQIAKDVDMFLGWIDGERRRKPEQVDDSQANDAGAKREVS